MAWHMQGKGKAKAGAGQGKARAGQGQGHGVARCGEARHCKKLHSKARQKHGTGEMDWSKVEGRGQAEQNSTNLVVVQEGLALHELVILAEAVVEEVADAGVVGQHQPAHPVR